MKTFTHMTDKDLLRTLADVRFHSPVIAELCMRLEEATEDSGHYEVDCPVCKATLDACYDPIKEELNLGLPK